MENDNVIKFDIKKNLPIEEILSETHEINPTNLMLCFRDKDDGLIKVRFVGDDRIEMLGILSALQMEVWEDD